MPRHRPSPDQMRLPLDAEWRERFALLESIGWERSGLSRTRWRHVAALLSAVHRLSTQTSDCQDRSRSLARRAVLAEAMGTTIRTVQRTVDDAVQLGVLTVAERFTEWGGQSSNEYVIDWPAVARLGLANDPPEPSQKSVTPPGQIVAPPGQVVPPYIVRSETPNRMQLVDVFPTAERTTRPVDQTGDQREKPRSRAVPPPATCPPPTRSPADCPLPTGHAIDWDQAASVASEVCRRLGGARSERDWQLAVKLAAIAQRSGEAWLADGLGAVRAKREAGGLRKPWGYLWQSLAELTAQRGGRLERWLAAIDLPAELQTPPRRRDLSERMTASARGGDYEPVPEWAR